MRKTDELEAWTEQHSESALEPDLPIIDSHHHLWDDERGRYLVPDLLKDIGTGHNIVATVFVECKTMYRANGPSALQPIGEIEFINRVAEASIGSLGANIRLCAGIVGHADLTLGDNVRPVLEALSAAAHGRLRGIRHGMPWDTSNARRGSRRGQPPRYLALNPAFHDGFGQLAPLGLSFDAWLFYPQLPELAHLLRAFPETTVILNHSGGILGIPPHVDHNEVFSTWRNHLQELEPFRNLSVKLGGLGMVHCGWDFPLRKVPPSSQELATTWRPYVEACIETFGTERCMMESNFPAEKQSCGYGIFWNAMKRITAGCSAVEKAELYSETARRVYRLPV